MMCLTLLMVLLIWLNGKSVVEPKSGHEEKVDDWILIPFKMYQFNQYKGMSKSIVCMH